MKPNALQNPLGLVALSILFAFAIAVVPTQVAQADQLYATGIGGGKTKPLIDIENKLVPPPAEKPIREAPLPLKKGQTIADTSLRNVEDASKYQLYIEPVYPRKARLAMKEGEIEVLLTFDKAGKMKDARIVKSSTPGWGFEQAVLAASLEARLNGHGDREVTVKATLKFELEN